MFAGRVVRIGCSGAEKIAKYSGGLRNLVLAKIEGRFARIPLELHASSVAS